MIIYVDGASRGNPGPAGAGVHIEGIVDISEYLGEVTNNEAEYRAAIIALEFAVKNNVKKLTLYSDSRLVVEQLLSHWIVRDRKLSKLWERAVFLKAQVDLDLRWIPREQNTIADALANRAINEKEK